MTGAHRKPVVGIRVYLETGSKRVFAAAHEWPGWCRSAGGEAAALEALLGYAGRYRDALAIGGLTFEPPASVNDLEVVARYEGGGATDFGVPSVITDDHEQPLEGDEMERWDAILAAAWRGFDGAVRAGTGRQLDSGLVAGVARWRPSSSTSMMPTAPTSSSSARARRGRATADWMSGGGPCVSAGDGHSRHVPATLPSRNPAR